MKGKLISAAVLGVIGVFALYTGFFVSVKTEQKIFLVIVGLFFIVSAVSNWMNRKK